MDETHAERRARGLKVMATLFGTPEPEKIAQRLEDQNGALGSFAVDFCFGDVWSRPGISPRDRSLVVISILAALNVTGPLKTYAKGAVNFGMTPEEVREVMIHMSGYAGFPRAIEAMKVVNEALAEMGHAPKDDKLPPADRLTQQERRKRAGPGIDRVTGGSLFGNPGTALPAMEKALGPIGTYALDFVFGEIWERPQLSKRDRSFLVVSVLGALGRTDELKIHIPGAFRHGLSKEEVQEIIVTLAAYAGFPVAVEATHVLHDHLAQKI